MRLSRILAILLALCLIFPAATRAQEPDEPVIFAVLFYTDRCRLCHTVIQEILPPLQETYGDQLQVVFINTQGPQGYELYRTTCETMEIVCVGVPMMLVGEEVLVGQMNIEALLPRLIDQGLAANGIGLPPVPELIAAYEATVQAAAEESAAAPPAPSIRTVIMQILKWVGDQIPNQQ